MEVTINTGMKSYLAALARHLVAPLVPITPSDHTRRAQFMLTFFGLLAPLVILGEWMTSAISMKDGWRHHPSFVPLAIVFTVVMLVILIRTSYYRIAAGITIGVLVIAALLSIALDTPPVNFSSSSYLIMSMLLASVMFSVRGAALLGVSQNLALFVLALAIPAGQRGPLMFDYIFAHLLVSILAFLILLHQRVLDTDWKIRLSVREDELRSDNADMEQRVMQRTQDWAQANADLIQQIAEREHAEHRLAEERNLLRTLLDNLPDPVFVVNRESRYILSNAAHAFMVSSTGNQEAVISKYVHEVFAQKLADEYNREEQEMMRTGVSSINALQEIQDWQGVMHYYLMSKIPLRDAAGQVIGLVGIGHDITERKQAEDKLTTERNLLTTLINNLPDMIFILDRERRYLMTNPAHSEIINGRSPESLVGKTVFDVMPAAIARNLDDGDRFVIESGQQMLSDEELFVDKSGENRWLLTSKIPLRDADGQVNGLVGISHDITERKKYEMSLQQANATLEQRVVERTIELQQANVSLQQQIEERQQAEAAEREQRVLAEALRDTAAAINSTLNLDEVLDRILVSIGQILPYDTASIMLVEGDMARVVHGRGFAKRGLRMEDVLALRLPIAKHSNLREMYATGQPIIISNTRDHPDWLEVPETAWINSYVAAPIRVENRVMGFINLDSAEPGGFGTVVAAHLQAFADQAGIAIRNSNLFAEIHSYAAELETRVAERAAEVMRERAQLRAILDSIHEGVLGNIGGDTPTVYVNKGLLAMFGYEADEWDYSFLRQPEMSDEDYEAVMLYRESVLDKEGVWRSHGTAKRKDGSEFDAEFVVSAIQDSAGKRVGAVTIVRDVSLEKALQESKSLFVANASHELRTPLTNIMTRLYLLRRQPERLAEHIDVMEGVSLRMRTLIEQLLDLSRYERGLIPLKVETANLNEIIQSVIQLQGLEADKKGISLQSVLPEDVLLIQADAERITQVITNLVVNAINYTPESGQVRIVVEQSVSAGGNAPVLRVHVQDTGIGMSPEQLLHIFQPFYRVSQQVKGTGLGLSIARQIMLQHGGDIEVQSAAGVGSRFTLIFPPSTN
jgi:PAS domain S-box-containing protein